MKRVLILNFVALSLAVPVSAGEFPTAEGQRLQVGDERQAPAVQAANPVLTAGEATRSVEKRTLELVVEWPQTVGYVTHYTDKVDQGVPVP